MAHRVILEESEDISAVFPALCRDPDLHSRQAAI